MRPIERLILLVLIHYNAYWKYLLKQLARRDWKQSFSGTHRLKINKNARYQCRFEPIFQTRKSCLNYFNVFLHVNIIFQKCFLLIFLESVGNALQVFFPVTIIKLILTTKGYQTSFRRCLHIMSLSLNFSNRRFPFPLFTCTSVGNYNTFFPQRFPLFWETFLGRVKVIKVFHVIF